MLKKTCVLGFLAAAALIGGILSPAAQASQVEVNKQTGLQNASSDGHGNVVLQDLNQANYQNQLQTPGTSGYYHSQPGEPQLQISDQAAQQSGAALGTGNAVIQELEQNNWQKQYRF